MRAGGGLVSVLLPCRDAAPWLPACIRSLEAQTLDRFEVLAVDDGSTDGTHELLAAWAARDRRVRLLATGGVGLVGALRLATERARGSLLARMDADDVARPERLAAQRAFLEADPATAACGTGVRLFPRQALGSGYRRYERWLNGLQGPKAIARDLFVECPIAHPTLMIRASALRAVGGYRDAGWPEDYDLVLRLARRGYDLANLPERLLAWRARPGRLSRSSPRYGAEAFRRCKVHHLLRGALPADRPVVVWGGGRVGKAFARALARAGRPAEAFVDLDPRKVGQRIAGAPVLDPRDFGERLARGYRPYVLAAVGSPGARAEIRRELEGRGLRELADYRAVA